jgi:hypothetical protein
MDDGEAGEVLNAVIQSLGRLPADSRLRVIKAILSFYELGAEHLEVKRPIESSFAQEPAHTPTMSSRPAFSSDTSVSPKQFLIQKQPKTDVEIIACLAYYLTHLYGLAAYRKREFARIRKSQICIRPV